VKRDGDVGREIETWEERWRSGKRDRDVGREIETWEER